jgi:feruloyl esterase
MAVFLAWDAPASKPFQRVRMRLKLPIAHLLKAQRRLEKTLVRATKTSRKLIARPRKARPKKDKLTEISSFGSNPGNLRMLTYVPPQLPDSAPLVVVLHGCLQTARLRRRQRLVDAGETAQLCPCVCRAVAGQQPQPLFQLVPAPRCAAWFRRGLVDPPDGHPHAADPQHRRCADLHHRSLSRWRHDVSDARHLPEVFAGGIIAGLPYGAASCLRQVMSAMKRPRARAPQQWGDLVRSASSYTGPRPTVSIWHGTEDRTVAAANAAALLSQWTNVHGVNEEVFSQTSLAGHRRRAWSN